MAHIGSKKTQQASGTLTTQKSKQTRRFFWTGLLFASPWLIGFLVFQVFPICSAFYYSLTDFNMFRDPNFIGLKNYTDILKDKNVIKSLQNTGYMVAIGLPVVITFSMIMALIMNTNAKGMPLFRTIFYLPNIVPVMASALLFLWVMNSQYGMVNGFLKDLGIKGPSWLNDAKWTKITLIIMDCWRCGSMAVIFLAALKSVPQGLYEAAEIDGASRWTRFWKITIPMISPTRSSSSSWASSACSSTSARPSCSICSPAPTGRSLAAAPETPCCSTALTSTGKPLTTCIWATPAPWL